MIAHFHSKWHGALAKMEGRPGPIVEYRLPLGESQIPMNALLGDKITLQFTGEIRCSACGRATKKSFSQGYCFPCSQRLARCDFCIVRPERCHYHLSTCREPEWGETHCFVPHCVYLADTMGLKVGVTRCSNIPFRWIDQGAQRALPIGETLSRRLAGLMEVALARRIPDKTAWQRMLRGGPSSVNLQEAREQVFPLWKETAEQLCHSFGKSAVRWLDLPSEYHFQYPLLHPPRHWKALTLDKTPHIEGRLVGIKGQYLLLEEGVINIRRHTRYHVTLIRS